MKINNEYDLEIDGIGTYILKYHYTSKVNTPATKDVGYFGTPHQALAGCLRHGIIETDLKDLKTVCDKLDKLKADIIKAIKANGGIK